MRVIGSYTRDTNTDTSTSAVQQQAAKAGKGHGPKGPPPSAGAVKVSLSQEAQNLASTQATSSTSDVDTAKVDRLKSAISAGTFPVDSAKIAAKIVDED
jgi:flagellar biosynthesis anti-sigma factor FlgM